MDIHLGSGLDLDQVGFGANVTLRLMNDFGKSYLGLEILYTNTKT